MTKPKVKRPSGRNFGKGEEARRAGENSCWKQGSAFGKMTRATFTSIDRKEAKGFERYSMNDAKNRALRAL